MSIVRGFDLPTEFAPKIMKQVENVAKEVSEADMAGREDLRDWQMVTIDGEDSKDLDDAVSLTMDGENYILGVHIADVSNYVQEHSALDVEALNRGTSVYLVDRVIPMLPHALSNGICSLNAGENRLALSCIMTINPKGKVIDHKIVESVVKIDRRMTYTAVKEILEDHNEETIAAYRELVPMFEKMGELAALLRGNRMKRGSIDFDFPETKILLDKNGRPLEIKPYDRNTLHISQEEIHPKELQKLLGKIEGTPEEALISRLTLRSMKQAKYTTENTGHFGLAASCYCHFTSPIRRYPDLQIHRIIKETLRGRMNHKRMAHYETILPEVAKHSSETERRADEAERETEKLKKAQYMAEHIGEVYEGVISGVTSYGMYVELPNTVEGLVHVTSLTDDYYQYFEDTFELVGEVTNRHYKLGQKVYIRVIGVDEIVRTIDFELAEATGTGEMKNGKRID